MLHIFPDGSVPSLRWLGVQEKVVRMGNRFADSQIQGKGKNMSRKPTKGPVLECERVSRGLFSQEGGLEEADFEKRGVKSKNPFQGCVFCFLITFPLLGIFSYFLSGKVLTHI